MDLGLRMLLGLVSAEGVLNLVHEVSCFLLALGCHRYVLEQLLLQDSGVNSLLLSAWNLVGQPLLERNVAVSVLQMGLCLEHGLVDQRDQLVAPEPFAPGKSQSTLSGQFRSLWHFQSLSDGRVVPAMGLRLQV